LKKLEQLEQVKRVELLGAVVEGEAVQRENQVQRGKQPAVQRKA
jgi:hypothetical protein